MITAIESYIESNFSGAKLTFEGVEPRDNTNPDAPLLIEGNSNFVIFDVTEDLIKTHTVGNNVHKVLGSMVVHIFTLHGLGRAEQNALVKTFRVLLKSNSFKVVGSIIVKDGSKLSEYTRGKWRVRVDQFTFEYTTSEFA